MALILEAAVLFFLHNMSNLSLFFAVSENKNGLDMQQIVAFPVLS